MALVAKILTVSDQVAEGTREDRSGPTVATHLEAAGFAVLDRRVVADGVASVAEVLGELAADFQGGLVVTTGGTGFSPRDWTPEATRSVIDREAPGLAESMRRASPLGPLSRGVAGTLGGCLVVNLPGSPVGAVESLDAILGVLPHALELLSGARPH